MTPDLHSLLRKHEGSVSSAYLDSEGYLTIGVGHLIDKRKNGSLPNHIIADLLDWDIDEKKSDLYHELPWAAQLDFVRECVLVDMAFNLGVDGLLQFKKFLVFVQAGNYKAAATEMLDSKWATQVGSRATRLSTMMETGLWPADL